MSHIMFTLDCKTITLALWEEMKWILQFYGISFSASLLRNLNNYRYVPKIHMQPNKHIAKASRGCPSWSMNAWLILKMACYLHTQWVIGKKSLSPIINLYVIIFPHICIIVLSLGKVVWFHLPCTHFIAPTMAENCLEIKIPLSRDQELRTVDLDVE